MLELCISGDDNNVLTPALWVLLVTSRVSFWVDRGGGTLQFRPIKEKNWAIGRHDPDFISTVLSSLEITAVISALIWS